MRYLNESAVDSVCLKLSVVTELAEQLDFTLSGLAQSTVTHVLDDSSGNVTQASLEIFMNVYLYYIVIGVQILRTCSQKMKVILDHHVTKVNNQISRIKITMQFTNIKKYILYIRI